MEIISFTPKLSFEKNDKTEKYCLKFKGLLQELRKKDFDDDIVIPINKEIESLNIVFCSYKDLRKKIKESQLKIVGLIEKKANMIVKNHYRNLWLALGMSAFGLPIGMAIGFSLDNIGLLIIGLPIGMVIGMAVGMNMDNKAKTEGRQIDFEIG